MYSVYIHTTPNNKKYVGVTKNSTNFRWRNGTGYSKMLFEKAIKKYGWENIKHGVFAQGLSLKEAEEMEVALIAFFDTTNPKCGYNVSLGGHIAYPNPSDAFREKIRIANTGKNNHKSIPIVCIQTGAIYDSIHLAAKELGLKVGNIKRVLIGRNKKTGGYSFDYVKECDRKPKIKTLTHDEVVERSKKKVNVYSINGDYICTFNSRTEASRALNIPITSICNCINNYKKTSNGYIFKNYDGQNIVYHIERPTGISGKDNPSARAIDCFSNDGSFLKHYEYASLAAEELKCNLSTIIKVCKGKLRTHKGYIFKYSNNMKNKIENKSKSINWEAQP